MAFIGAKVKGGDYASASEVVRAGLRARESGMKRSNAGCARKLPCAWRD